MEELAKAIEQLKTYFLEIRELKGVGQARDYESKIRNIARKCMIRNDLRLTAEILFNDIYNALNGFDRFDPQTRMEIVDEMMEKIDRLFDISQSEQAIKDVPSKLPPPPDYAVKAVEQERQKIEEEKREIEERSHKREAVHRPEPRIAREEIRQEKRVVPRDMEDEPESFLEEPERRPVLEPRPKAPAARDRSRSAETSSQKPAPRSQEPRRERKPRNERPEPRLAKEKPVENKPQDEPIEDAADSQEPFSVYDLNQPVMEIAGIGKVMAEKLNGKNIRTVCDLLYNLPRDYEDRRNIVSLAELSEGAWCSTVAKVDRVSIKHPPKGKDRIIIVAISDGTGQACCKFFGGRIGAIKSAFPVGEQVLISGEVERFRNGLEFHHPDSEIVPAGAKAQGKIISIYSETEGLSRRRIRGFIRNALDRFGASLSEPLPVEILKKHRFLSSAEALAMIHFPASDADMDMLRIQASEGHRRLVFEELFLMQLGVFQRRKNHRSQKGIAFSGKPEIVKQLTSLLPFQLTEAQKKAVNQIVADMKKELPMYRLLQGDVGSGKTIVALFAAATAMQDGYQAALMAPTEILAEQHLQSLAPLVEKLGFSIALLTGQASKEEQERVRSSLAENKIHFVVGTHSLIQEATRFANLGLAIIDEQHRFGVAQRQRLVAKGQVPDLLTMTATPIPRTLAMTAYGDLDISVIDEKPKGRKPVTTHVLDSAKRDETYRKVKQLLQAGQQGFIVFPVIEGADPSGLLAAEAQAERLAREEFADLRIGLIHGRMKAEEKEKTLRAFRQKELDLLAATTVIEVGIDVPGATVMVVENAERFGLAQLHQLRGRIGRGDEAGECFFIVHQNENQKSLDRLKVLETMYDGLQLAEKDLEMRGQGDLLGTRQHGLPALRFSDLARDIKMLETARQEAQELLEKDPILESHPDTQKAVELWWSGSVQPGCPD